jgi:acylphosphatase
MTESVSERPVRAHILVSGRVQGVGYRAFAARVATEYGLVGGVRNLDDGRVELDVEGQKTVIEAVLLQLHVGPPAARVQNIETTWGPSTDRYADFQIRY